MNPDLQAFVERAVAFFGGAGVAILLALTVVFACSVLVGGR